MFSAGDLRSLCSVRLHTCSIWREKQIIWEITIISRRKELVTNDSEGFIIAVRGAFEIFELCAREGKIARPKI